MVERSPPWDPIWRWVDNGRIKHVMYRLASSRTTLYWELLVPERGNGLRCLVHGVILYSYSCTDVALTHCWEDDILGGYCCSLHTPVRHTKKEGGGVGYLLWSYVKFGSPSWEVLILCVCVVDIKRGGGLDELRNGQGRKVKIWIGGGGYSVLVIWEVSK